MFVYRTLAGLKNGLLLESASTKPSFRALSTIAAVFLSTGYTMDSSQLNYKHYSELVFEDIVSFYEKKVKDTRSNF